MINKCKFCLSDKDDDLCARTVTVMFVENSLDCKLLPKETIITEAQNFIRRAYLKKLTDHPQFMTCLSKILNHITID